MKMKSIARGLTGLLGVTGLFVITGTCQAADVYLVAKQFSKTMPDGVIVTMWGFAEDADANLGTDGGEAATSPGPLITVDPADPVLNIHVRNDLAVPVSIIMPGQSTGMTPVKFTDAAGRERVRSFTHETPAGGTGIYSWASLRPGSYVYQSGTHPAVQVQMGLYGALKKDYTTGEAYAGVAYDNEAVLFHSEIDPALHAAVAGGTYGTPAYPSTIDYSPRYFLINGEPYPESFPVVDHKPRPDETLLLRFLSAGLQTHVPVLVGPDMEVVAEDGNLYPYPRRQYSVLLTAGKTVDALLTAAAGRYGIYDRRLALTNGLQGGGGMQTLLFVNSCPGDINNSGAVDIGDYSLLLSQWGSTGCTSTNPCSGDLNGDGAVNIFDYSLLIAGWGSSGCLTP